MAEKTAKIYTCMEPDLKKRAQRILNKLGISTTDAIREAITNAIAHRSYNSSANVHITIFYDRIEVWNPGKLHPPLTYDDLKGEHKSIPNNPLLANLLFLTKYIERWGTGTNDIVKWCVEHELPEPLFKEVAGGFSVVLRKFKIAENLESMELNERQRKAVEYLKGKGKITNREYVNLLQGTISGDTALNDLRSMVKKGIISIKLKGRSSYYRLSNKLYLNFSLSAIFGWDIYQGDEDILPGLFVGFSYSF